jgi:diguanylate cyclase (GGDEF)-like protein
VRLAQLWHCNLSKIADPALLFPLIALALLTVVWAATIEIIRVKRADIEHVAAVSSQELLGTYEAQVVRALREIDQTLNLIRYWHDRDRGNRGLAELNERGLLPSDLLFVISIADRHGAIVDSTRAPQEMNVAHRDYFRAQIERDAFFIGQPPRGATGQSTLQFSRRLNATDGVFDGIVIVAVDAGYFVSGYDAARLGAHGVLGLIGTDGIIRVRRTGDAEFSGEAINYASVVTGSDAVETDVPVPTRSWDGVRRWSGARELYGFPVAVLVGLSVDEQLASAYRGTLIYLWRAGAASALIIVLTGLLGRMSWQLGQSRSREGEIKLAHAERVEYLAYHDGLTGLPNRSLFSKLLGQSINEAQRYDRQLAVAFLDLDRFKQINDTLGHDAGDQLLREVANRLKGCVRGSDSVARLGGDEFVALLLNLDDPKYAASVAQKIMAVIARPFTLNGREFRVTASIGISAYPQDGLDEQTLTKNADIAMYQAKAEGKNNFQFYSAALNANSLERLTLESGLRHALEHNEFRLCYQAKRDIGSGRITGMEALLRWEHPDLGLLAPMQFIPMAEETGLIVPIGRWVLETACSQNVAWQNAGAPPLTIAVNLTARQFVDERLLEDVSAALRTTGMDPHLLEFEISESILIGDVDATLRILTALKRLGTRIAIDDFGIGYSSLTMLQRFPLDTIKIDRSFIRTIAADPDNWGLADAVITMGKNLSLTVVAQGVETGEQAEFLRAHACDELQGFYLSRPLPPEEFTELLLASASPVDYFGDRLAVGSA